MVTIPNAFVNNRRRKEMQELIHITEKMTRAEKMKARKHNREIAYAQMKEYHKNNPLPPMTEEERLEGKKLIKKILKEKYPDFEF